MSVYVDYKVTIWRRAHFRDDTNIEELQKQLEDFKDNIFDEDLGFTEDEFLFETEEDMPVSENEGYATIELHEVTKDGDKIIYQNGLWKKLLNN